MKRCIACMLTIGILLLCGCTPLEANYDKPVSFYYLTTTDYQPDQGLFSVQIVDGNVFASDATQMLSTYFSGQQAAYAYCPFPNGLKVVQLSVAEDSAELTLNRVFGTLEGIDLTLACACITMTLCDYLQINTVTISALNTQLSGKTSITLHKNSLLLRDDTPMPETN